MEAVMTCSDCGKEFKKGDTVYEFTSGTFDGDMVIADSAFESWCEECELKRGER